MINLEIILQHDICDHMMDHFTLEMIMTMNMVAKKIPDLTKHHKIKDVLFNNFSQDPNFFDKFCENDKLISCIYEHKIIAHKNFIYEDVTYKLIEYYSRFGCNIEKIFSAIINNNISYIYFCLFVHDCNCCYINMTSVAELFHKHNLYHMYEDFIKSFNSVGVGSNDYINYPWLTISLIIGNREMIKNILNLYNTCTYYFDIDDLGGNSPSWHGDKFDCSRELYKYVTTHYPELKQSFDEIKINEFKMKTIYDAYYKLLYEVHY